MWILWMISFNNKIKAHIMASGIIQVFRVTRSLVTAYVKQLDLNIKAKTLGAFQGEEYE